MNLLIRVKQKYRDDGLFLLIMAICDFLVRIAMKKSVYKLKKRHRKRKFEKIKHENGRYLIKSIQGSLMKLNLNDFGISKELVLDGVRERETTYTYQKCLEQLYEESDGKIFVLDIGANIGYYAFQPVALFGSDAQVYAIEPISENFRILKQNIKLNSYENSIRPIQTGVGAEVGEKKIYKTKKSNHHTFNHYYGEKHKDQNQVVDEEIVKIQTVSKILSEHEVNPADVDVIRFDVEGFEAELLRGAEQIFESNQRLLLNIEIHPQALSDDDLEYIIDLITEKPIDIISPEIDRLSELKSGNSHTELVLFRN